MNRPIPGTVQVAVRHILSDKVTGGIIRPKTRTVTWQDSLYRVRRPKSGREIVELTCPVCDASLLAEVSTEARTRRTATLCLVLAAVCAVVLVAALGYAFHEGGRTLPEGQSLPVLFSVSVIAVFVMFVAGPMFYVVGRGYNGVSLLATWRERRLHQVRPVRGG
ncbi:MULTISPECIES: hypothetical protein [Streptomyces]|uniref:DUF983 domain-containing protein n=2 Tax=Streptomyces TaxID=1883 RepID=A0ABV9IX82_9ACTN